MTGILRLGGLFQPSAGEGNAIVEDARTPGSLRTSPLRSNGSDARATPERVMDAALRTILELGFYRTSSNEIARRAGVTWGVIQHHFGTREALLVAVLRRRVRLFTAKAAETSLTAKPGAPRLKELFDLLNDNYGDPEYLSWLQILINLRHDPTCSPEIGQILAEALEGADHHLGRLIREALGPAGEDEDFRNLTFSAMRGLSLSHLLLEVPTGTPMPGSDTPSFLRQRDLLIEALVALARKRSLKLSD